MTSLRDGSFLDFQTGLEMLRAFKNNEFISDIFEAFIYMDGREEKLRMKRDSFYSYILQLKNKGFIPMNKPRTKKTYGKKNSGHRHSYPNSKRYYDSYGKDYEYVKK